MTKDVVEAEKEADWDENLTPRERKFLINYCTLEATMFNAGASYQEAYTKRDRNTGREIIPERSVAESSASRLMKRERVRSAARKLLEKVQENVDAENVHKVLNEIAELALFNPSDIIDAKGKLKVKKLSDLGSKARAVAQITPSAFGAKVTLVDRAKYVDMLSRYLRLVRPEVVIDSDLSVIEVAAKITGATAEDAIDKWNEIAEEAGDE